MGHDWVPTRVRRVLTISDHCSDADSHDSGFYRTCKTAFHTGACAEVFVSVASANFTIMDGFCRRVCAHANYVLKRYVYYSTYWSRS